MSEASGIVGAIIYETISLVLKAGEVRPVYGDTSYLTILSATNAAQVAISFNGASFFPLQPGIALSDFKSQLFYVQNTDVAPNTVLVAKGEAALKDNRLIIDATNNLSTTVTNTVAMNLTTVGGTAVVTGGVAGLQGVGGSAAHSAASTGNPVRVGGRVNTAVDTTLVAGDVADAFMTTGGAQVVQLGAVPEVTWQAPAAAGGILNTTVGVVAKAAGAAGVRNYIKSAVISSEALTTATEFLINDGAAGTVLFRYKIPATTPQIPVTIVFDPPLRGTAATLVEIKTATASGAGAVYANLYGYQAP